jgi:subtilase family serine protease
MVFSSAGFCAAAGVVAISSPSAASPSPAAAAHHATGFTVLSSVAANKAVSVEVALPLRHKAALKRLTVQQTTPGSRHYHQWLNPNQFRQRFGATNAELRTLGTKLGRKGLAVTPSGTQSVNVTGTTASVNRVFATRLVNIRENTGSTRIAASRAMSTPKAVRSLRGHVIDLSAAPRMHTFARQVPTSRLGVFGGYWFTDLKQAYEFPKYGTPAQKSANGAGETIGIVMSSAPNFADAKAYFSHENLATPNITVHKIDGGSPFNANNGGSFEVNLDVQQSGGMAPKAHIIVYDMHSLSDQDVFDAYKTAVDDNQADVISSSFGGCELTYTAPYNNGHSLVGVLRAEHNLFLQGAAQGQTFIASSGDEGGKQCVTVKYIKGGNGPFIVGGSNPATDPEVTGVGGTNLETTFKNGSLNSAYVRENADADTLVPFDIYGTGGLASGGFWGSGSGPSAVYGEPSYQKKFTGNKSGKRETPDVSLHMGGCPGGISLRCNTEDSFDVEAFAGQFVGVIGTSASAPDFAGAMALYDQVHHSRAGAINPTLYRLGSKQGKGTLGYPVYHRNIPGNNGAFNTAFTNSGGRFGGWDQVLGNGTLIVKNFIFGGSGTPAAGVPQSPSNP